MESTTYTIDGKEFELKHFGVKGMKWGRRKARLQSTGTGRRGGRATNDSPEAQAARKEARRQKAKRAAKIGAAVVAAGLAAGLAAYGTKKVHDVVRDKNEAIRLKKAQDHINEMIRYGTWNTPMGTSAAARAKVDANFTKYAESTFGAARRNAARDSFGTAVRNVANDYLDNRRRR